MWHALVEFYYLLSCMILCGSFFLSSKALPPSLLQLLSIKEGALSRWRPRPALVRFENLQYILQLQLHSAVTPLVKNRVTNGSGKRMATVAAAHYMSLRTKTTTSTSPELHKNGRMSSTRVFLNFNIKGKQLGTTELKKPLLAMATGNKGGVLVQKVNARQLDRILTKERTMPFVVDFYATWCGPCITMAQEVELLAVEYVTRVRFLKVDTDEEYQLAHQMEVRGLPTLVFISSDPKEPAVRMEGILARYAVRDVIDSRLKALEEASQTSLHVS